jgi:hypothetical protein
MTSDETWKSVFKNWPAGIPRRGVVLSILNEAMPFKGFMVRDELLLLERTNPDPLGVRYIMLGYDAVNSVRMIDPLKESVFTGAGFVGKFSNA